MKNTLMRNGSNVENTAHFLSLSFSLSLSLYRSPASMLTWLNPALVLQPQTHLH